MCDNTVSQARFAKPVKACAGFGGQFEKIWTLE